MISFKLVKALNTTSWQVETLKCKWLEIKQPQT
jgi:hypothetical protein